MLEVRDAEPCALPGINECMSGSLRATGEPGLDDGYALPSPRRSRAGWRTASSWSAMQRIDSSHSIWLFDTERMRFRRVPQGADPDAPVARERLGAVLRARDRPGDAARSPSR